MWLKWKWRFWDLFISWSPRRLKMVLKVPNWDILWWKSFWPSQNRWRLKIRGYRSFYPPPDLFLVMLISAFNLFYLLETQEIFMEIALGKWSVHDISRIHRVQIDIDNRQISKYLKHLFISNCELFYQTYLETTHLVLCPRCRDWQLSSMMLLRTQHISTHPRNQGTSHATIQTNKAVERVV